MDLGAFSISLDARAHHRCTARAQTRIPLCEWRATGTEADELTRPTTLQEAR
jgi:hypothetical protein